MPIDFSESRQTPLGGSAPTVTGPSPLAMERDPRLVAPRLRLNIALALDLTTLSLCIEADLHHGDADLGPEQPAGGHTGQSLPAANARTKPSGDGCSSSAARAKTSSTGRASPLVDLAFDFSGPVTSFTDSSAVASDSHATGRLADADLPPEPSFIGITEAGGGDSASDEDPMADVARMAPLGRLVSEMESVRRGSSSHHPAIDAKHGGDGPSRKRARLETGHIGASSSSYPSRDPMDPIEIGLCDVDESRELVSTFFRECHVTLPIFDPASDTWESLRRRSAFVLTAIMMVGARMRDSGAPPSELQRRCQEHAESMGKAVSSNQWLTWQAQSTLLYSSSQGSADDIEVVQGLIILASWGDASWRMGGHAFRIAMEMGLYRCLPQLVKTDMGAYKSPTDLEKDRPLVIGARVWLALCKMEYDFSGPVQMLPQQIIDDVEADNEYFAEWHSDWLGYYDRLKIPQGDYLRDILFTGMCHSILTTNTRLLLGITGHRDVASLSSARKEALAKSIHAASSLVHMAVCSTGYSPTLTAANCLTQFGMVFTARILIRLAGLMPEAIDLRRTAKELEALAVILQQVPGHHLSEQVHQALDRARRNRVLPPASRASSPPHGKDPLPILPGALAGDAPEAQGNSQQMSFEDLEQIFNSYASSNYVSTAYRERHAHLLQFGDEQLFNNDVFDFLAQPDLGGFSN
ncbi:hypothetical protein EHS25_007041 [Saitozyma podzolica]|uniref:Xylanolytic transcriptional activator regulatory domain-containing protein n=1 Tax=Saitozyma podzolica TaxID=1890683 RepID=A0A427XPV0_9TREE|nr:hypothetical protein EHS25_007041 [Saitozyma podzolica]